MDLKRISLVIILAFNINFAFANTKALGFELGNSTVDNVYAELSEQTKVIDKGFNKYSKGQMLLTDGAGYAIEGLNSVLYIFDEQNRLTAIIMNMENYKFNDINAALASKYKLVTQQKPFVGNQYAKYKTKDATIEIDAPHLAFNMEVRYMKDNFLSSYRKISANENLHKKQYENSLF